MYQSIFEVLADMFENQKHPAKNMCFQTLALTTFLVFRTPEGSKVFDLSGRAFGSRFAWRDGWDYSRGKWDEGSSQCSPQFNLQFYQSVWKSNPGRASVKNCPRWRRQSQCDQFEEFFSQYGERIVGSEDRWCWAIDEWNQNEK